MEKLLLHQCCAVCTPSVLRHFVKYYETDILWFNPNIYPEKEYDRRLESAVAYVDDFKTRIKILQNPGYEFWEKYINGKSSKPERCLLCYKMRLEKTAEEAKNFHYNNFSTTLLISKYQYHDDIKNIGENIAKKYSLNFIYVDFRKHFYESRNEIFLRGLYMQKYCGCKYSLEESKIKK